MTTQALSGSGNISYTNQTGKSVRLIINYMTITTVSPFSPFSYSTASVTFSWGSSSQYTVSNMNFSFGKNIAYSKAEKTSIFNNYQTPSSTSQSWSIESYEAATSKNLIGSDYSSSPLVLDSPKKPIGVPMEYILAPNESFTVIGNSNGNYSGTVGSYNILIITED